MKRLLTLLLAILLVFTGTACTKDDDKKLSKDQDHPEQEGKDSDEELQNGEVKENLPYTAPLTGLGSETPMDHRVIMVVVENHPQARPQSGLNKADMVYEVMAEGGITRFAAFYHSEYPENVGPVRSIRPYFLELGGGYDAILVHAGWSPEAKSIIQKNGLPSINGLNGGMEPNYFWRVKDRKAPHNMYTDFDKIIEVADRLKFRKDSSIPQFLFLNDKDEITGNAAKQISIKYYASYEVTYTYDESNKVYLRTMEGEPHVDLISGQPLSATNILVIRAKHRTLDNEGRLAIDLDSGGDGYLFQRGKGLEISWKSVDGVIRAFKDGKEIGYFPGKTWIQIIPDQSVEVTIE